MKKIIAVIICVLVAAGVFAACAVNKDNNNTSTDVSPASGAEKLKIVTTIFPEYDWVRQILGKRIDNAEITLLLDSGVDLHSYQPTVDDIVKISNCDLFIYVGGESDEWVEDALAQAKNKDMAVINLLDTLGESVKAEEIKEGMQADHDHEHEEIEEADIKNRDLSEFNGEWKSLLPLLKNGDLNEYVEHEAEEDNSSIEDALAEITENWACEAEEISVNGNSITFTYAGGKTESADYEYAGFAAKRDEDGDITGVRYQFETDSQNAPKYVQFNDHGYEPAEEVEHFHIYFGNDSFDALLNSKPNPFFVKKDLSASEIIAELTEGHDHEEEYDEHVWLSLKNAAVLCKAICEKLSEIDSENAGIYKANTEAYIQKLNDLDNQYKSAVDSAKVKTLVFGDRFPFRYLVDDYGLDYYAAFIGCSAESEASFETIVFLAKKLDELGLKSIMQIESADGSIAGAIKDASQTKDQTVLTLDSMQSTLSKDIDGGATYLSIMESNLQVLKEALK